MGVSLKKESSLVTKGSWCNVPLMWVLGAGACSVRP